MDKLCDVSKKLFFQLIPRLYGEDNEKLLNYPKE